MPNIVLLAVTQTMMKSIIMLLSTWDFSVTQQYRLFKHSRQLFKDGTANTALNELIFKMIVTGHVRIMII